jgi:hypothetical protein
MVEEETTYYCGIPPPEPGTPPQVPNWMIYQRYFGGETPEQRFERMTAFLNTVQENKDRRNRKAWERKELAAFCAYQHQKLLDQWKGK